MGGVRWSMALAVACLVVLGCQGPTLAESIDLANDEGLYVPSGYEVQVPTDQSLVLLPVVDRRNSQVEEASDPRYPTVWMKESYWPRAMPVMLHDVIRMELTAAGLGSEIGVDPAPRDDEVLLAIELLEARTGREEREFGRRSIARVRFRYTVTGPVGVNGVRSEVLSDIADQVVTTKIDPRQPTMPSVLSQAMRAAVIDLMGSLDEQNVTRSGLGAPDPVKADDETPVVDVETGSGERR